MAIINEFNACHTVAQELPHDFKTILPFGVEHSELTREVVERKLNDLEGVKRRQETDSLMHDKNYLVASSALETLLAGELDLTSDTFKQDKKAGRVKFDSLINHYSLLDRLFTVRLFCTCPILFYT